MRLTEQSTQFALVGVDGLFWTLFFSSPLRCYVNEHGVTYFSFEILSPLEREIDSYVFISFDFALDEEAVEQFDLQDDLSNLFGRVEKYYAHCSSIVPKFVYFDKELKELGIKPGKYPRKVTMYQLRIDERNITILMPSTSFMPVTRVLTRLETRYNEDVEQGFVVFSASYRRSKQHLIGLRPRSPIGIVNKPVVDFILPEEMTVN
jgi:hypothetical protein